MDAGFSLVKKKKISDTEWGIGWPIGYVKLSGMIDESMDTEQMKANQRNHGNSALNQRGNV
jgi:regulator of sigma E protease